MEVNSIKKEDKQAMKIRAVADGSFNDLQDKIRSKANEGLDKYESFWPIDIIPDTPVTSGTTILENWDDNKFYSVPFTVNESGEIELGEPEEVRQQTNYIPISQKDNAGFVFKDEAKRLVTGPVAIPGCKDCDFKRGEKVLTVDEIEDMVHAYNSEFRLVDKMHLFRETGEVDGEAVENYTLKHELKTENVLGEEVTLPVGTWMATSKITSDEAWEKVQDGTYKGYSGTYISRKDADNLKSILNGANKSDFETELKAAIKRTLIKDLEDPVPVTISLVPSPCVGPAIFTSIKSDPIVKKAGRKISNATLDQITKIAGNVKSSLDEIKNLISTAETERTPKSDKSKLEVLDMNEDEVKALVKKEVEEETKALKEENKVLKEDLESLKKDPEKDPEGSSVKKEGDPEEEKLEDNPVIKEMKEAQKQSEDTLNMIAEKLGIDPAKKGLESPDDERAKKNKPAGDAAFYAEAGLKMNGRPKDEK